MTAFIYDYVFDQMKGDPDFKTWFILRYPDGRHGCEQTPVIHDLIDDKAVAPLVKTKWLQWWFNVSGQTNYRRQLLDLEMTDTRLAWLEYAVAKYANGFNYKNSHIRNVLCKAGVL